MRGGSQVTILHACVIIPLPLHVKAKPIAYLSSHYKIGQKRSFQRTVASMCPLYNVYQPAVTNLLVIIQINLAVLVSL